MKPQNSKELKNQYLDNLLSWYEKEKKNDEVEIRKSKIDFANQIKKFDKHEIKNTIVEKPEDISLWKRIKKTLGIG